MKIDNLITISQPAIEFKEFCHCCKQPIDKLTEGIRINRIATLGAEFKTTKSEFLKTQIKNQIIELGGKFDSEGFIRS